MYCLPLLLILVISSCHGWFVKPRPARCISKKDCVSCVSWSGSSCRWCPRDKKCHAHDAVVTNPCSRSQNIVNQGSCGSIVGIVDTNYDRALAYKMIFLSALAYADDVARYIHSTTEVDTFRGVEQVNMSCAGNAQCSGYTALSHAEKAIVIAFRGSQNMKQVVYQSIKILTTPVVSFQSGGKVQNYFNKVFVSIWSELKPKAYKLITNYPSYKVWVTGHSLGGAMASLASTVIAFESKTTKANLILYTFGQPRVGNFDYALTHDKLVPISFRVTHYRDPVVHLPSCLIAPATGTPSCISSTAGPYHHGKEIFYGNELMTKYSSYRKCKGLPLNEDPQCSNKLSVLSKCSSLARCINNHRVYFGIVVGKWWESQ